MDSSPPTKPNRRTQQSAETRSWIISTARTLFIKNGFVATTVDCLARECGVAPINKVLIDAAAVDPAAAALQRTRDAQRYDRYMAVPGLLRDRGGLKHGQQDDEVVAAFIWNTGHPQTYRFLITERGWSEDQYAHWCYTLLSGAFA